MAQESAQLARDRQQRVGLRPTLMIGLGGTGQKTLVQLKARFMKNYGGKPDKIEFLCFDTDQAVEQVRLGKEVVKLDQDTELINIGGIETRNIIRGLDKNPAIAQWITEDKDRVPMSAIRMGAQQVRTLGRLALFVQIKKVNDRLTASLQRLRSMKLDFNQQGDKKKGINVFIIASVCGGTGSGMLLDIAYLVRDLIEKRAPQQSEFCSVNAVLALPSVFPNVDQTGIQSNAYAALSEIDYCFSDDSEWKVDYGDPNAVPPLDFTHTPPFNICYLVDANNEEGKGLTGLEEIAPMIAEAIYLQVSSQVGEATDSSFDNVRALAYKATNEEGKQKPTAYSSLGTASLVFPAAQIIEYCATQLGRELVQKEILRKVADTDRERVDAAVTGFMQSNQLETDNLLQRVSRDAKNNIMRIQLDPRALDNFKESELLGAAQAFIKKADERVDNEFTLTLDANKKALADTLSKALNADVERLVDDPTMGLATTIAYLEQMDARLGEERATLDKARDDFDQRRTRTQPQTTKALQEFSDSFRSFPVGRGGKVKEARDRYVKTYESYLNARFEGRKREIAVALLASLSATIQVKRAALQRTSERLQFISNQFEADIDRNKEGKAHADFILAQNITNERDIDAYYQDHLQRLGKDPESALLDAEGPLHVWLDLDQDQIKERILRHTGSVFADIAEITVERVILEKKDEVEPRKRLFDVVNRSVPFWTVRTAGVLRQGESNEEKIVVIGVENQETSIYKDALPETGQRLATTFDPHQIAVLQTKHGLPLFALTQFREFKSRHDYVLQKALKPLYVLPEVRPGGDRAKTVFALGLVYGYVFKSGTYYYMIPADEGHEPIRLSQGMADSLYTFRNDNDAFRLVDKKVEDQNSKQGSDKTKELLEAFVKTPYVLELKGGASQTNIDRSTMTRDTSIGLPNSQNFELMKDLRETIKHYLKEIVSA